MKEEKQRKGEGVRETEGEWGERNGLSVYQGIHVLTEQQYHKWVHNYTAWHPLVKKKRRHSVAGLWHSFISEGNPSFVSMQSFLNTVFLIVITPYSFSFLNPAIFSRFFLYFSQIRSHFQWSWSHPSGSGSECGNDVFVCLSVSGSFMTLSSVDEREEVSSVIYSRRPSCYICLSLRWVSLSHTHLPSLPHLSQPSSFAPCTLPPRPLVIWLWVWDSSCTPAVSLCIPLLLLVSGCQELWSWLAVIIAECQYRVKWNCV